MTSPFKLGFYWGLSASALWLLTEGLWLATEHEQVSASADEMLELE